MDLCRWEVQWVDHQETWDIVDLVTSHQSMAVDMTGENADTAKTIRATSSDPDRAVTVKRETKQE